MLNDELSLQTHHTQFLCLINQQQHTEGVLLGVITTPTCLGWAEGVYPWGQPGLAPVQGWIEEWQQSTAGHSIQEINLQGMEHLVQVAQL